MLRELLLDVASMHYIATAHSFVTLACGCLPMALQLRKQGPGIQVAEMSSVHLDIKAMTS